MEYKKFALIFLLFLFIGNISAWELSLDNGLISVHDFDNSNVSASLIDNLGRWNATENSGGDITLKSNGCMNDKCLDSGDLASGERVQFTQNLLNQTKQNVSISFWFNKTGACNGYDNVILLGAGGGTDFENNFKIGYDCANSRLQVLAGPLAAWTLNEAGTETINKGEWNHIIYNTYKSGSDLELRVWVNGVLDISSTWSSGDSMIFNPNYLYDGSNNDANERPSRNVTIDELYVWNRTLTTSEVSSLYNSGAGSFYTRSINLISPEDSSIIYSRNVTFNCEATSSNDLLNISLLIDGVINKTILNTTSGEGSLSINSAVNGLSEGQHNWTCISKDYLNNIIGTSNRSLIINTTYEFVPLVIDFDSSTISGANELFYFNFITNGTRVESVYLNYNNTNYLTSLSSTNNNYTSQVYLNTPGLSTSTNITFNWIINLENGDSFNTNTYGQVVNPIYINTTCSPSMSLIYNFTLTDELTKNIINGISFNGSIKAELNLYSQNRLININNYNFEVSNDNNLAICINDDLNQGQSYQLDLSLEYGAKNYSTKFYNLQMETLNQANLNQNISLYLLSEEYAQEFKLNVRDKSYVPIKNALVVIERKYLEDGKFYITEIPKTDSLGVATSSLQLNDVIYNFHIYLNGTLISSFNNVIAVCQNPTLRECTIDFNQYLSKLKIIDYFSADDFNYTLGYDKETRLITSNFLIPSNNQALVTLEVIVDNPLGTSICSDSLNSTSGTLSCLVSSNFGNTTIRANLYKDGVLKGFGSINLKQDSSDIFGSILILLSVFSMITLLGLSLSDNPIITGIFIFIGVFVLMSLGIINNSGFYGASATILYLLIALIMIFIKAGRRT